MENELFSFSTKTGNEYIIQFTPVELDFIKTPFSLPVVDVSLIARSKVDINNFQTFSVIIDRIQTYIINNDCILYYYCDHTEIERRDKSITPQCFRHKMFNVLLERADNKNIIKESIIIDDEEGDHYISILSTLEHKDNLEKVLTYVSDIKK